MSDKYFNGNILKSVGFRVLITLCHKGFHIITSNRYIATFLPLTTVTPKQEEAFRGELLSEEGVMGKMSAHVSRDAKYDKVVEYLLGRYLLVDTLDHAMSISKKYHYSVRMVTLDGERWIHCSSR